MPTARESRAALEELSGYAVASVADLLGRLHGGVEAKRAALFEAVPAAVDYYGAGAAALAADLYEDERARAGVKVGFRVSVASGDRTEKIKSGVAWASGPLLTGLDAEVEERFEKVMRSEVARPYRDTILTNRRNDPEAVGWRRIAAGGCKFCVMLADRGAVYKHSTVRFAAHPNCMCTAQPVFTTNDTGIEASTMQYRASRKTRTAKQKAELRDYLNAFYPDFHG